MKSAFYLLLSFLTIQSAYNQTLTGIVQSSEDGLSIEGAHIVNISKNKMAISSEMGNFRVEGDIGDTLVVSNINYITKRFIINTTSRISILLKPNLIQLEEVIVSNLPKTANDFRKKLIAMPMQDNGKLVPFGVTPGKIMPNIPVIYDKRVINGLGYAISNPLKYTASKLNGKFQEKVKYWAIQADLDNSLIRDKKYNRTLVASLTKLESDELTNFIHFMDLADSFINSASEYEIAERIKEEFKEYQLLNKEN
ncbi:hypothetical protein SAMN05661096_03293 [Marivirga sericea]|uniref:CarboxypepD_reg-like domain-containing protein n=1 Tax=Marivirga sericea TaxID=1028 RepID=A0A1X7KZX7_9BACT|nr:hypothetical protein [Marivirga sericea]SMG46592.1 hypothetical protein SAMN05661096_03293 [Marivirga sericea]